MNDFNAEEKTCRECGKSFDEAETCRRHQRVHAGYQAYVLKFKYDNFHPLCACGCGAETTWSIGKQDFQTYTHGHHMTGRKRDEETKRKIGEANSRIMKEFCKNNPDVTKRKVEHMLAGVTEESRLKAAMHVKETRANWTDEQKQEFSNTMKRVWNDPTTREIMLAGARKGGETFKQRFAAGEFDFTERNDRVSKRIAEMYVNGEFLWADGKRKSAKMNKTFIYRSSWEKTFMELLDSDGDVVEWDYEPFFIRYEFEGKSRRYVPDFLVMRTDGSVTMYEVKPTALHDFPKNAAKFEAARKMCQENGWQFKTWCPETNVDSAKNV